MMATAKGSVSYRASLSPVARRTVSIPFTDLMDRRKDLSAKIEEGLGPGSLGIISVSGVPNYSSLRRNLLHLGPRVANLPERVRMDLEDPESRYNFGWSHGKEQLESGKYDTLKGSFYANPILDTPTTDAALLHRYPSYCRPNKWPNTSLPELEYAFKALGQLILDVGLILAHHCDRYVLQGMDMHDGEGLEQLLRRSRCHKGRLLYYFPIQNCESSKDKDSRSWCGWHTDHGSLTGLTCGLYTRNSVEVPCPDSSAGLYIQNRDNEVVKATFGEDEIAYQIGETTEILSNGRLCATPHCVQAPCSENAAFVDRITFALFMQPDWDQKLQFPPKISHHPELIPPNGVLSFGEFSKILINKYYHPRT